LLVLLQQAGIGLEVADHIGCPRHRRHRPFKGRHKAVNQRRAKAFNPRAVDAPQEEQPQKDKHQKPHQNPSQGAGEIFRIGAVFCHV
jgi:hypothetical protein